MDVDCSGGSDRDDIVWTLLPTYETLDMSRDA